jgi:hypothetical protein
MYLAPELGERSLTTVSLCCVKVAEITHGPKDGLGGYYV